MDRHGLESKRVPTSSSVECKLRVLLHGRSSLWARIIMTIHGPRMSSLGSRISGSNRLVKCVMLVSLVNFGVSIGIYLNDVERPDILIKLFHLLNALSDLMMLPKDMLLDKSIRKEVCSVFSGSLIKRVLYNFLPDEFCPEPVPYSLMDSLDSKNSSDLGEELVNHHPLKAPRTLYHPPLAASIMVITRDSCGKSELRCSSSSLIDKAHTRDDELDKLNSPWSSILSRGSFSPISAAKPALLTTNQCSNQHAVRYACRS